MSDAHENDNLNRFLNEKCLKIQKKLYFPKIPWNSLGNLGKTKFPEIPEREFPVA